MSKRTIEVDGGLDIKEVMEKSVCVILGMSRLWTRRSVSTDAIEVEADKSMLHVGKDILEAKELKAVERRDHKTRLWVLRRSSSSPLFNSGVYLFPLAMLSEVYSFLEDAKKERDKLVEAFVDAYPKRVKEAKARLKDLFDQSEYPPVADIKSAFSMQWQVVEFGTPENKLKAISKDMFEKEKAKAEANWSNATEQIRDALRVATAELVTHFVSQLEPKDGKAKRFRAKSIEKVEAFLEQFEKRDLTNDKALAELVLSAKKIMSGVDAKTLKKDEALQTRVTQGFNEIKKSLEGMVENKPARRMTLAEDSEEVA